nr:hypothetical protein [Pantoea sp. 201603H]
MSKFKIGDLVELGMTSFGSQWLVMPVVRVTKTQAIFQIGDHVERIRNSTGKVFGRHGRPARLWDGKNKPRPLKYPEVEGGDHA